MYNYLMLENEVKFIEMKDGDKEDYELLANFEDKYIEGTADRLVRVLKGLDNSMGGYKVSRLEHSLQTASRALRDNASDEMVVASLLHDIGDEIAPLNHSELAAAVLKPFVSEKTRWIVEQHGLFQAYYYNHYYGKDRNLRDKFIGHEFYKDTINFCEKWDQASFDPSYDTIPLKDFIPLVQKIFNRQPYRNL
jgi:predicted HD phosphohydrolase